MYPLYHFFYEQCPTGAGGKEATNPPFYGYGEGTLALETLGLCECLQGFWRRDEEKTFTLGCGPQAMIQGDQIVKRGKTVRGTQRYLCQNPLYAKGSFRFEYCNRGGLPEVKHMIIDMSLNARGVRDTARSLHICPNTVLRELRKKETALESVNTPLLRTLNPDEVAWDLERAGEAEMDEM